LPFSSAPYFLLFLPIVAATHALLRTYAEKRWSQCWLLGASLFFYAYAAASYLPIVLGSILFNWAIARVMTAQTDPQRRKLVLWLGLAVDILVLFLFKYVTLFLDTIAWFHGPRLSCPQWGFPLGVSFFTLNQIMYLVDAYPRPPSSPAARKIFQGLLKPNSLFDHLTFVTLFPYVVSGPLVRVRPLLPQLSEYKLPEPALGLACRGLFLFSLGLVKKVVFADSYAPIADAGFGVMRDYSMVEAWIYCLAALFHLYFDFSGYSDMALGSAWMLGIDIPPNFNSPLKARSIVEFWQRWHMSLSSFITDYLYTPMLRAMGPTRQSTSAIATVLAMVIAALWHGPAWTFVAWGLAHGSALVLRQIWTRQKRSMPDGPAWLLTFLFLTATIVFLRSSSLADATHMLSRLVPHAQPFSVSTLTGLVPMTPKIIFRPIVIGAAVALLFQSSTAAAKAFRPTLRTALATSALLLLALFYINSVPARTFVYFGF
jgi:D-alanyl-lipoteichoic acid acyltransferase DltB (MBOAT superfamily)